MTLVKFKRNTPTTGFDRLFDDFFTNDFFKPVFRESGNTMPSANISENENSYHIELVAPGMEKEDFKIELDDQILSVKAEKGISSEDENVNYKMREFNFQSFERSFRLPKEIKGDKIKAGYSNGILTLEIPKIELEESKKIKTIKVG